MRLSRNCFITASASAYATIGIVRYPAGAAEFTYRYGNGWLPSHPMSVRTVQAAGRILQESDGRLRIRVFPQYQLGTDAAMVSQVRTGALEFLDGGFNDLQLLAPTVGVVSLPFLFANQKEAVDAFNGPLGKVLRGALTKLNLYVFESAWDGGFRQIANSVRRIYTPDDMKGLKIRTPTTPTQVKTFQALGASPVAIDGSLLYTSIQTHLVDGAAMSFDALDDFKLYEFLKYASTVNLAWTGAVMIANPAAWQKLPSNLRDIVERNFAIAAEAERGDVARREATVRTVLQGHGVTIDQADIPAFKNKVRAAGLYTQWRAQYGADTFGLLEQAVGKLT
jgi:tripartite ATP-independent transporter DctP family solute receptor